MFKKSLILIIVLFMCFSFVPVTKAEALECNVMYKLDGEEEDECEYYFGSLDDEDSTAYFLNEIFSVFKWLAPLLCLVFSVIEFVKAAASQDKEALNKAATKTGKRIVLALLLFFIPTLVNFFFELFGWWGTCGIG